MPDPNPDEVERVAIALAESRCWPGFWGSANDAEKSAWRHDAIAAIAALRQWTKAEDAPVEWEGREMFIYEPWTASKIRIGFLPFSYSRRPEHCGGTMLAPLIVPQPPASSDD